MNIDRYHFCFASDFHADLGKYEVQSDQLQPVAAAFDENVQRIAAVAMLPTILVGVSTLNQSAIEKARFELGIQDGDPRIQPGNAKFDNDLHDKLQAGRIKLVQQYAR